MIKLKSLKEPTDKESDGLRILIARYRPRYLPKDRQNWNEWWKELAPSVQLLKDYKDKSIDWKTYKRRFRSEIRNNPEALKALDKLSDYSDNNDWIVTLLCHCRDEKYCHRSIIEQMVKVKEDNGSDKLDIFKYISIEDYFTFRANGGTIL